MSLTPIGSFLPKAFDRIDRHHTLKKKQNTHNVESVLQQIFPSTSAEYSVEYYDGCMTIYTASHILKQKIHTSEQKIIKEIQQRLPTISISQIRFKGPKL
ncbi:MAG: hypothetical protein AAB482_04490 [Patescibacteria group bacterium]